MLTAIRCKTNHLMNPLGIDSTPLLSWNLSGDGARQCAWQIRAAETLSALAGGPLLWESGWVEDDAMLGHAWEPDLKSRQRVFWQVRIKDDRGECGPWSEPVRFETGLLQPSDWQAKWITGDYDPVRGTHYPADLFQKRFAVSGKVRSARLYATACGVYEAHINGRRVGAQVLTPGSTSYEKRVQYQVYDVTDLLADGENTLDLSLGEGWFRGNLGVWEHNYVYGNRTAVLAQLEWTDETGRLHTMATDDSFFWCNNGPVYYNDLKGGEHVDAARTADYAGRARLTVWDAVLCCSENVPVTEHERLHPVILQTPDGETVLDFGQNIAGYVEFSLTGERGHCVSLTMGEKLDADGNFTLGNLLQRADYMEDSRDFDCFQKVVYHCAGTGRETYKPSFCVQGFRYVRLGSWPCEPQPEDFTAIAVYSDMEVCGRFSSSSADLNGIVENTLWSMKGNFLDVPTDCPTRERAGWTGDAQLFFNAGCYLMDFPAFFRKWVRDLFDDQADSGMIYNIVPRCEPHGGPNAYVEGSAGWTDAGILIPARHMRHYFDRRILTDHYDGMKRLAAFLLSRRNEEGIVDSGFHFGEWTEPDVDIMTSMSDTKEEATAYLIYTLRMLADVADELGHPEDAAFYRTRAGESQKAYLQAFVPDGKITSERMCKYVRPLALGLLDGDLKARKQAQSDLVSMVRERGHSVGTGFLSTPFLLDMLTEAGCAEDAYQMLLKESYPGWVYEIRHGATTIWENWPDDASLNHYSKGAICDWIFGTACGIRILSENTFSICPVPGSVLDFASFEWISPFGRVSSRWEWQQDSMLFCVEIPAGCTAEVTLPGADSFTVGAGSWRWTV